MGCCAATNSVSVLNTQKEKEKQISLDGTYHDYKLIAKTQYNHDSFIFRFSLESQSTKLGLPIGNHVMLKYDNDSIDLPIMRAYTPISNDSELGYFELLIKIYSDGEMTQQLDKIKINDSLTFKGPLGSIFYDRPSHVTISKGVDKYLRMDATKIGMLAGGTGITPLYQMIKYINQNSETDKTEISLIFSNKTEKDILLRQELEQINSENNKIQIRFTLSQYTADELSNSPSWNGDCKRIDADMIETYLFPPDNQETVVMYCGPPKFNKAMKKMCLEIGYAKDRILKF